MTLAFLNIGTQEMVLIIIVILMLFGGKKLPELARGLGRGIREFKDASEGIKKEISDQINNFEKDLDVTVEEKPKTPYAQAPAAATAADVAADAAPEGAELANVAEEPKAFPQFTAPENTFQHEPERKPESGDTHYTYDYSDHFATAAPESENSEPELSPVADAEKKKDTTQNA